MSIHASILRLPLATNTSLTTSLNAWPPLPFHVAFYDADKTYSLDFIWLTNPPQPPPSALILKSLKNLGALQKRLNPNDPMTLDKYVFEGVRLDLHSYWEDFPRHVFIKLIQVISSLFYRNGPVNFGSWIKFDEIPIASFDLSF